MPRVTCALALLLIATNGAFGRDPREDADTFFELKVRPVLARTCFECHGGKKVSGKLGVDSRPALLTGGRHGPAILPGDATLWTAHCCRKDEGISAPRLGVQDLQALQATLKAIESGTAHATGFYPRVYPVNDEMTLDTGFRWNNR